MTGSIHYNPNNPAGTIMAYDELVRFVDAVPEPDYKDAIELSTATDTVSAS